MTRVSKDFTYASYGISFPDEPTTVADGMAGYVIEDAKVIFTGAGEKLYRADNLSQPRIKDALLRAINLAFLLDEESDEEATSQLKRHFSIATEISSDRLAAFHQFRLHHDEPTRLAYVAARRAVQLSRVTRLPQPSGELFLRPPTSQAG